jgi:hypothetical protein
MKKTYRVGISLLAFAIAFLIVAPPASAQSAFDGTWHAQQISRSGGTMVILLQDGVGDCKGGMNCTPEIRAKTDGTDQPISGSLPGMTASARDVSPSWFTIVRKQDGKTTGEANEIVSNDGSTLVITSTNYPTNGSQPVNAGSTWKRIAPGPAGAHKISGTWELIEAHTSNGSFTATFKSDGDGLDYSNQSAGWSAKFDGKDYPATGQPGNATVSLKRIDEHSFEETLKRDGKPYAIETRTVSDDGKTMTEVQKDLRIGTTTTYVAYKQ